MLKDQNYKPDIQLKSSTTLLEDIIISDQQSRKENFNRIKPRHVSIIPGNSEELKPF